MKNTGFQPIAKLGQETSWNNGVVYDTEFHPMPFEGVVIFSTMAFLFIVFMVFAIVTAKKRKIF